MEMEVKLKVCDVCFEQGRNVTKERRPVSTYHVQRDSEAVVEKVLCGPHSRILDALLGHRELPGRKPSQARPRKAAQKATQPRRRRAVVKTTIGAIEASKGA